MRRADLVRIVEENLEDLGFSKGSWLWQPRSSELIVIMGGMLKTIKLRTSITKRALIFEMGRLAGLAEAAGIGSAIPMKRFEANDAWSKPNGLRTGMGFAGMPA